MVLLLITVGVPACQTSSSREPEVAGARRLVERYISADTAGAGLADSTESLFFSCEGDRAVDFVEPVAGVAIVSSVPAGDTVRVVARYEVLGHAESWDTKQVGAENWRFQGELRLQADTFLVVAGRNGPPRILCGPYHGNHWSVAVMASRQRLMDDESQKAWKAALSEAKVRWHPSK